MSKIMGMDGKPPQEREVKIDASELKDIVCEECGGKVFRQASMFKKLSAPPNWSPNSSEIFPSSLLFGKGLPMIMCVAFERMIGLTTR